MIGFNQVIKNQYQQSTLSLNAIMTNVLKIYIKGKQEIKLSFRVRKGKGKIHGKWRNKGKSSKGEGKIKKKLKEKIKKKIEGFVSEKSENSSVEKSTEKEDLAATNSSLDTVQEKSERTNSGIFSIKVKEALKRYITKRKI